MGIEDAPLVYRWLTAFWQLLSSAPRNQPICPSDVTVNLELNNEFCWLEVLVLAADRIVHSNGEELDTAIMLVSYGLATRKLSKALQPKMSNKANPALRPL